MVLLRKIDFHAFFEMSAFGVELVTVALAVFTIRGCSYEVSWPGYVGWLG